ncbi:Transmembrane transcriptional regulator (anti-sigma factor RsiW) [Polaromonas sp. OV174]|uniref:anti-sigma factor family protein n=1 Tax=Polaromonas sp. OV174 TaxID=1855300 RepID=UPI0008E55EFD|nr:anti-sigma factor [Polaromonas sp. OV174]SFB75883.1 Transmembrane transcriptional regulator (anti-sigma factor RsiW) [Polaromonas sp. OV174]
MNANEDSTLDALLKDAALHRDKAPAALRQRILGDIATHSTAKRQGWGVAVLQALQLRWLTLGSGFVAGILASAVALQLLGGWPSSASAPQALSQEIVASHVRSLMAQHLFDIPSTDQHTVKPWFLGKLDYSPMVHDLSAAGFPLTGGRLDYIGGRPVAVLVYARGKHVINLYTWPDAGSALPPADRPASRQGFYLLEWTQFGMHFWAVSDVSPGELAEFAQQVRAAVPP